MTSCGVTRRRDLDDSLACLVACGITSKLSGAEAHEMQRRVDIKLLNDHGNSQGNGHRRSKEQDRKGPSWHGNPSRTTARGTGSYSRLGRFDPESSHLRNSSQLFTAPFVLYVCGCMPRGPNVAISLCIVSNAKQDVSYFCIWACCPVLKRLALLSGHLANCSQLREKMHVRPQSFLEHHLLPQSSLHTHTPTPSTYKWSGLVPCPFYMHRSRPSLLCISLVLSTDAFHS